MSASHTVEHELVLRPTSVLSRQDVKDLWQYRELLWILALRDVKVRYKQATMGIAWALAQPLSQVIIFTFLFHRFAGVQADGSVPYPVFCLAGLTVWGLFATGLSQASESLVSSANLVTKVYFPKVLIPIATVLVAGVDMAIASVCLLGMMVFFHVGFHLTAFLAVPIAMVGALWASALGLWLSALNLEYRDVRHAVPFFIQLLVYLTPVFYPVSIVPPRLRGLLVLNPMAAVVDGFRAALFGNPIPFQRLAVALLLSLLVGLVGFIRFRRLEQTFADRI
jgi:lipopolysaccharide transport system permease protein